MNLSKRETITYIIIFLWISIGILGVYFNRDLTNLASYFVSLTGFIGVYIFGETKRRTNNTYYGPTDNTYSPANDSIKKDSSGSYTSEEKNSKPIIKHTKMNSKREFITYLVIIIWTAVAVGIILSNRDLLGPAAYFAALTPFVGSYIIGETFNRDKKNTKNE